MASTAQDKKTIDFDPFACVREKKKKKNSQRAWNVVDGDLELRECLKSSFVEYNQIYTLLFQREEIRPLESDCRATHLGTA